MYNVGKYTNEVNNIFAIVYLQTIIVNIYIYVKLYIILVLNSGDLTRPHSPVRKQVGSAEEGREIPGYFRES